MAAGKELRTISKSVVWELGRKPSEVALKKYQRAFENYDKVLCQQRKNKDKIYSLHEPKTACIAKGKAHKSYEFGTKVAVVRGRNTGIISSIKRFSGNLHDSKTLEESLAQFQRVRQQTANSQYRPRFSGNYPSRNNQDGDTQKGQRKRKIQTRGGAKQIQIQSKSSHQASHLTFK